MSFGQIFDGRRLAGPLSQKGDELVQVRKTHPVAGQGILERGSPSSRRAARFPPQAQ
jgi:hypothetical protein